MKSLITAILAGVLIAALVIPDTLARGGRSSGRSYSSPGTGASHSSTRVRGYTRKDGTYVAPHRRSTPDGKFGNNWSTRGNQNPYTGKEGTRQAPPQQP